jgi:hypothetical protein
LGGLLHLGELVHLGRVRGLGAYQLRHGASLVGGLVEGGLG